MRSPTGVLLPVTIFVLCTSATADSTLDICHSEPKILFSRDSDPGAKRCKSPLPILLIDVQKLHGNPFHSLHDTAWAVAHYMYNCLKPPYWPTTWNPDQVFIYMKVNFETEITRCEKEPAAYNRWLQPYWGTCMLRAVAFELGIPDKNIIASPEFPEDLCFSNKVSFFASFRGLKYRVRPWKTGTFEPDESVRHSQMPEKLKREALRKFANAPFNTYLKPGFAWSAIGRGLELLWNRRDGRIRVLVYDRKDQFPYRLRRKWSQPEVLLDYLKNDSRVAVLHLSEMPKSLAAQAKLFRWADVSVMPHGAALANSIFSHEGSDIAEIWKCCKEEVRDEPEEARRWTGWHAAILGLHLRYVQCHHMDGYATKEDLAERMENGDLAADRWCKLPEFIVDKSEIVPAIEKILKRQVIRVATMRYRYGAQVGITLVYGMAAIAMTSLLARVTIFRKLRRQKK